MLETFFESFAQLADARNGVVKLRELFLQLALEGKLVAQDSSDEPVSELLLRIKQDKKLRRGTKTATASTVEKYGGFCIPGSWEWVLLEEIADEVHYGYTASAKHDLTDVRLLRITDIQNGKVDWSTVPGCEIDPVNLEKFLLANNDILIARTGGTIGKTYIVENLDLTAVFASYLIRVIPNRNIYARYIKAFLESRSYWTQLYAKSMGTGQPNINATSLKSLVLPLPPFEEQERIVAKIDELMRLCDELEERQQAKRESRIRLNNAVLAPLNKAASLAPEEFEQATTRLADNFDALYDSIDTVAKLRSTILQLAIQGKLVPQDPRDESAQMLLARLTERKRSDQGGSSDGPELSERIEADEKQFRLPSSWEWVRLGEIVSIKHGFAFSSERFTNEKTPFVLTTPGNFYEKGGFRDRGTKTKYYKGTVDPEFIFKPGDLIIPMTEQAAGLLGSPAFIPDDGQRYVHNQRLGKLIFYSESVAPEFMFLFFNSAFFRNELAKTSTGMKVKHTSPKKILRVLFPLCSQAEQGRIVAKVNQLMSLCDGLEAKLRQAEEDSEKLMTSAVQHVLSTLNGEKKER